ncbi:transglycosylase SLT domain-containing protein [Candidatus Gracilibacteria bacterium]|nr:transglycosylase SLT domain-containing protein [Candidatus Gracilibacteria bacterium]
MLRDFELSASYLLGMKQGDESQKEKAPQINVSAEKSTQELLERLFEEKPKLSMPAFDSKNPRDSQFFMDSVESWKRKYLDPKSHKNALKRGMEKLLANDGEDLKMIYSLAKKYQIPFEIMYVSLAESGWRNVGENNSHAAGYWQFTPGTAKDYGLKNIPQEIQRGGYTFNQLSGKGDERLDKYKSTDAAMRYLKNLRARFVRLATVNRVDISNDEAWAYALWSYNRGRGHVQRDFLESGGNAVVYSANIMSKKSIAQAVKGKTESQSRIIVSNRDQSSQYVPKNIVNWPGFKRNVFPMRIGFISSRHLVCKKRVCRYR